MKRNSLYLCNFHILLSGILFIFFTGALLAQSTILKLPTTTVSSSFTISDSNDAPRMKLYADGGFYLRGNINAGAIPVSNGKIFLWNPKKGALRAGYNETTEWIDANIGETSVALGFAPTASGFSSTAIGYGSVASNNNSVAIGWYDTASGVGAIALGHYTVASGYHSTAIGSYVSTNNNAGSCIIGDSYSGTAYSSTGDEMTMRFAGGYRLFTNHALTTGVTLAAGGGSWSSVSDMRKKEKYSEADGEYFLKGLSKLKLGSWNYIGQDSKTFRHYGPMAQEIFQYFGKDAFGTIGNDTTLATADMDGIMMICLQALEKRTRELQQANEKIGYLENLLHRQKTEQDKTNSVFLEELTRVKNMMTSLDMSKSQPLTTNIVQEKNQ